MKMVSHPINGIEVAEIISEEVLIQTVEDALDLSGTVYYHGFDTMILYQKKQSI